MNMEISGLGKISSGEYDNLSISGCSRLDGEIRCNSFSASGLAKGDSIECNGDFSISGNSKFNTIKADKIKLSGCLKCKNAECNEAEIYGLMKSDGKLEAKEIKIYGGLCCGELICAETAEILFKGKIKADSIRCSKLTVRNKNKLKLRKRLTVKEFIEADEIDIERVKAQRVSGKSVKIGNGCIIKLVQYSESIEISPKSKVKKTEKI